MDMFFLESINKGRRYYVVFDSNKNGQTLVPRIPQNFMTKNGYEDNKTKRIPASDSIGKCLKAISKNLKNEKLFVHKILTNEIPYNPTIQEVPDKNITGEVWFMKPVKLKCVGEILITDDDGKDGQTYTYGPKNTEAELYGWKYEWKEKF